jgi:hypothetical protein
MSTSTNLPISNPVSLDWTNIAWILLVVLGVFALRTLKQFDINQKALWEEMKIHRALIAGISEKLTTILAEHKLMMKKGGCHEDE